MQNPHHGTPPPLRHKLAQVNVLARYNQHPRGAHWTAGMDLLRYSIGSPTLMPTYGSGERGWCAMVHISHQTLTTAEQQVGTVLPNGAVVLWASKKQPTVALSTMEAEYRSAILCAREVCWLRL